MLSFVVLFLLLIGAGNLREGYTPCFSRDIVTNRILLGFFGQKAMTNAVTGRDSRDGRTGVRENWSDGVMG